MHTWYTCFFVTPVYVESVYRSSPPSLAKRATLPSTNQHPVHAPKLSAQQTLTSISLLSVLPAQTTLRRRDVSLENLLLAEGGVVKLVDFGLSLRIPQAADGAARVLPPQGRCGKQYYMSPEVLAPSDSTGFDGFAVDVWACGIVLFMYVFAYGTDLVYSRDDCCPSHLCVGLCRRVRELLIPRRLDDCMCAI